MDIGKLETSPVDLKKLSKLVKNDIVKKTEYNELFEKVDAVQTADTINLAKKAIKQKLMNWKKITTDNNHAKYIVTQELNELTSENFIARLAQANLASKIMW